MASRFPGKNVDPGEAGLQRERGSGKTWWTPPFPFFLFEASTCKEGGPDPLQAWPMDTGCWVAGFFAEVLGP